MKSYRCLAVFLGTMFLFSCAADQPVAPVVTPGKNSFTIGGGGIASSLVNLPDSTGTVRYDTATHYSTYSTAGNATFGKVVTGTGHGIVATISFPGKASGSFTWEDLTTKTYGNGLIIIIDSTTYRATYGTTTVATFGVVDSLVTGTFSGTLKSPAGATLMITDGRFSARRLTDK